MADRPTVGESLVDLCRTAGDGEPPWLSALRADRDAVAAATGGEPLALEVVVHGACRLRLGITSTGRVVYPLGPGGAPHARIEGTPDEVAAFILDESPLSAHVGAGVLHLPWADERVARLSALRRLVAARLREILDGAPAFILLRRARVASARVVAALAQAAVPAAVVAAAAVASATQPSVAGAVPADPRRARDIAALTAAPPRGAPATPSPHFKPATPRAAEFEAPAAVGGRGRPPAATYSAEVRATVPAGDGGTVHAWMGLHCDSPVKETVCAAVDRIDVPVTPAQER